MSRVIARCHPALIDLIPPPVPAAKALPDWLKTMPSEAVSETLGGEMVRTVKHCPPFLDAMGQGVLIPLPCDLHVSGGQLTWDWDFPAIPDAPITRAPLGAHVPEQLAGVPIDLGGRIALKVTSYWTLETEPGWQLLFTHPLNRADLPFETLSGVVHTSRFGLGYVHFPALWTDRDFEGVLPRGTPVAQVIAIPSEPPSLDIQPMSEEEIATSRGIQEAIQAEKGVYRKQYRN